MARGTKRNKTPAPEEATSINVDTASDNASELQLATDIVQPLPPAELKAGDELALQPGRPQFRSWVVDETSGYTRMTDEINRRLVLQFAERPDADTLALLKGSGFQFKPDYYGQRNVWVRANDFEGRLRAEAIEKQLSESSQQAAMVRF